MEIKVKPRIKICCIGSVAEAHLAIVHGAAALGLVASMPSGPGIIDEKMIREIARTTPPAVATFLLTSNQSVRQIVDQQRRCRTNTIQICDRLESGSYGDLREAMPGISLVQVIHVGGEESFDEACRSAEQGVDALLLDSGNQRLPVKQLGGTGKTHDWSISSRIRKAVSLPVFLAGGLNAGNVAEAIRIVQPFGLDLCSGVRVNGRLDPLKLREFFDAVENCRQPAE
jgi:phosphoribosylanthranilate isomerase